MGIQPIDLQTLFSQLDKAGKLQSGPKENIPVQQILQVAQQIKKEEEQVRTVKETKNPDTGAERIKDELGKREKQLPSRQRRSFGEKEEKGPETEEKEVVRDPELGTKIDLSG
ncbi:MAG: hypothetical protein N2Z76_09505 [Treponemataceae bacterium]|nr:hypothetical protein [Treponemataceae bacterium]